MIGLFDSLIALHEAAHVLAIQTGDPGSVIKWVTIDETDDYAGAVYHEGVVNPGVEAFGE